MNKCKITEIEGMSDGEMAFFESLNKEYPGYTFSVTPPIYIPDTQEIRKGIMVRLPGGEMRKLRHSWNREQTQDATIINDATVAEDFETAVMNELRSAIRKEMKLIT